MPLNLGFLLHSYICCQELFLKVITSNYSLWLLCACHKHYHYSNYNIVSQSWIVKFQFNSLFCRLFIDMTDVYCSKIIMECDILFRSWYKIYKNIKRNKLDNLVRAAAAKGYQGNSPKIWKTPCQNNHWKAFYNILKINTVGSECILKK